MNTDSNGRTVHTIQVSDVSTHVGSFSNPTDAKTLSESTTKFDGRGRVIYQTTWLSARGTVDPANPPIAGIGGVSLSDGLTTQYLYDDNLADGVGLDNSTGVSVSKLGTGGSGTFTVTYTFDPIGRKATEALTIGGQTYTITSEYNSRGELTKVTYPDSSISERTYHATGALNQLKLDGSTISTRTYDDGRRLTGETLGNGVTESRTYASDNLLTAISYGGTGTSIGNLSYTWDSNKNKTSETIGGTMSNYGFTSAGTSYDDEDRLTGFARASGTFTQSWSLTSVGDWNSITTNGTAQNRTHGPTHELLTAGGQNVTTDVKGNITLLPTTLTTSGVAMAVGYDFDNKLKSADVDNNGSNDVTFQYDALGRRVARQGTSGSFVYVQQDQQTIADYGYGDAPSSPTHRYVYASYIDEPVVRKAAGTSGTIHYYHRNQQFSITAVTTSSGSVAERYAYTAYGQPTILDGSGSVLSSSAINNRYTYTGREWDQTLGLYHFRARWMSGIAGRFMGRDPIGYAGSEWDLYEFVDSEALNGTDPSGQITISCNCMCRGGRSMGTWFKDVEVECDGAASTCCSTACGKCKFSGKFKLPDAEEDDLKLGDVVVDAVDDMVCTIVLICDFSPITAGPTGEGAVGCLASKAVCRQVKQCIKVNKRKPKPKYPKGDKWKCSSKARNWELGTACYNRRFVTTGRTESSAKEAAHAACVAAGCHKPGKGGDCGHDGCTRIR
ncbi:RHS repeat domain-containing protein [Pirellulaceae bacterium SH501]